MSRAALVSELFRRIKEKRRRIVIIGDVIVDQWVHGRVSAPCQEGCPKFVQESVVEVPGGAANAERCLASWDIFTSLHGYSRKDCPIKCRYVDSDGRVVFRADNDKRSSDGEYWWSRDLAIEMIQHCGAVLLSDYDKGFLTEELVKSVVALSKACAVPCVADMKRAPELYRGCVLKCNSEYQHLHNDALASLVEDHRLVVTAGSMNPIIWDEGEPCGLGYDLPAVRCVNHVGAGDCFAAHLTLALACGFSLKEAAAVAHSAGRVYVQHAHNRPPVPVEIAADLSAT